MDIKALYESDRLQALLDVFSQSKVLWVFRHYDKVVNSQDMRWKGKADVIWRILQDHDPVGWRGRNISEETRAKLIFEQEFEFNSRVMLVRYGDLVTELDHYFKAIFASLGLSYRSWQATIANNDSVRSRAAPILDDRAHILCEELYARFCAVTLYIPKIY